MKTVWLAITGSLLAALTYAQTSELVSLAQIGLPLDAQVMTAHQQQIDTPSVQADAEALMERNSFDSSVGAPDDEVDLAEAVETAQSAAPVITPACDFGTVSLIVNSQPEYAFASITTTTGAGKTVKIGDAIAGTRVQAISWNKLPQPVKEAPTATYAEPRRDKNGKMLPEPVPEHISRRIHQLGPNLYTIERAAFDSIFAMDNGLVRGTKVRPVKQGDEVVGMRLNGRGVDEGSLLHSVGIRPGDVLTSLNGLRPTTAQKALEAYGRLKSADTLTLVLERNDTPITFEYRIQ